MALQGITVADVMALASLAVSIFVLIKMFFEFTRKLASIEIKVDTMWDFTIRRGMVEAVHHKLAVKNSPMKFLPKAEDLMKLIAPELRTLYFELSVDDKEITDRDLAIEIERLYGQRLMEEICIPYELNMGACLVLAIEAAKGRIACH